MGRRSTSTPKGQPPDVAASEATYLALSLIGVLGGVAAGFDHLGPAAGAKRGLLAGMCSWS